MEEKDRISESVNNQLTVSPLHRFMPRQAHIGSRFSFLHAIFYALVQTWQQRTRTAESGSGAAYGKVHELICIAQVHMVET